MPTSLPSAASRALLETIPNSGRAVLSFGSAADGDLDLALEDAVSQAGYDFGFSGFTASIAAVDPGEIVTADADPVPLARAVLVAARALAQQPDGDESSVVAVPVCADSAFTRRRQRLVLTGAERAIVESPGPVHLVSAGMEQVLREVAGEASWAEPEKLESVMVTTARSRFKPLVEVFRGPTSSEYAVVHGAHIISRGHASAGKARAAAVTLLRSGPVGDAPEAILEVVRLVGRGPGLPYVRIRRTRVDARVVAKVVTITPKKPAPAKIVGWLFYGRLPEVAPLAD